MTYDIRTATRAELDIAVQWAAEEGWNPGLYDSDAFHATDPQGFFLGILDGTPIASISAVSYGPAVGFVGFYIVHPRYRGRGYGMRLWRHALRHLPTQNVGLDGVLAQQKNYEKSGFALAYRNIRYEGSGAGAWQEDPHVVPLSRISFDRLLAYDEGIFPARRGTFLKPWIAQPESLAVGYVDAGRLRGYGMIRRCRTGCKIGPLFADAAELAEALFQRLRAHAGAEVPVFLDVPEAHPDAVALATAHGMRPMFETVRMYTKEAPRVPLRRVFGVTTFELG